MKDVTHDQGDKSQEDPGQPGSSTAGDMSRREFAAVGAAAMIGLLSPFSSRLEALTPGTAARFAASVTEDRVEHLEHGVTRRTLVWQWGNLPPKGDGTQQTTVVTRTPTENGEVIEYDIHLGPELETADGKHRVSRTHARYEFVNGAVKGDMREAELRISGEIDGVRVAPVAKKVLRPISSEGMFPGLSTQQKLNRALELAAQNGGHLPRNLPGALQVIGDLPVPE